MTQVNGHPTPPPIDTAHPEPVVISRRVFVEETTTAGLRETFEPDEKVMNELGWVRWVTSAERTVVLGEGSPSESRERETEGPPEDRHAVYEPTAPVGAPIKTKNLPPDECIAVTATDLYRRIHALEADGYLSMRYSKRIGVISGHDILRSEHGASIVFVKGLEQKMTVHIAVALWAEFSELCRYEDKTPSETKTIPLRSRLTGLFRERQEIDEKGGVEKRFVSEAMFEALVDAVQERIG